MKNIPDCPRKPLAPKSLTRITKTTKVETITPIIGAGVEALTIDTESYIRGSTIRGLLRFWWRACNFQATSLKELYKAEVELFGAASTAGDLSLKVSNVETRMLSGDFFRNIPDYVNFPYRGNKSKIPSITVHSFLLTLKYSEKYSDEIDNTLWAWANFGGVGMRTRRGAGAIYIEECAPKNIAEINEKLKKIIKEDIIHRPWSLLSTRFTYGQANNFADRPWFDALSPLKEFRQGRVGRRYEGRDPKRSYWPEADSIRRITGNSSPKHKNSTTGNHNAFPRAELGLPLIIKFKDKYSGEPSPVEIAPSEGERWPSPLILKPIALQGGKGFMPILMIMNSPKLSGIRLKGKNCKQEFGDKNMRGSLVKTYETSPLVKYGYDNSIDTFEAYVGERWKLK